MESLYKWARGITAIFIGLTFLAASWPFIMIMMFGMNSMTPALLIQHLPYLLILVYLALSFRFMGKGESIKKRRIGLGLFIFLTILVIIGSFYIEHMVVEEEQRQEQNRVDIQEFRLKIRQDNAISSALKGFFKKIENEKILDVTETTK